MSALFQISHENWETTNATRIIGTLQLKPLKDYDLTTSYQFEHLYVPITTYV